MIKFYLFAILAVVSVSNAFVAIPQTRRSWECRRLQMSDEPLQHDGVNIGATERLLLDHKRIGDLGLCQEYGKTVKKDGLDGVRAFVWGIFDVSNYVFPALGAAMSFVLLLNMVGYGYFFDDGSLVIDTLSNIQQEQFFQEEAIKLAAEKVSML